MKLLLITEVTVDGDHDNPHRLAAAVVDAVEGEDGVAAARCWALAEDSHGYQIIEDTVFAQARRPDAEPETSEADLIPLRELERRQRES